MTSRAFAESGAHQYSSGQSGRKQSLVFQEEETGASMKVSKDTASVSVGGTARSTFPTDLLRETIVEWIHVTETD